MTRKVYEYLRLKFWVVWPELPKLESDFGNTMKNCSARHFAMFRALNMSILHSPVLPRM